MDIKILILFFICGGSIVALVSYFGSQEKGLIAGFISNLPLMTLITISTIYYAGGSGNAVDYLKGILVMLPAWLAYVISVIILLPRLGLLPSLAIGVSLYLVGAFVTLKLAQ